MSLASSSPLPLLLQVGAAIHMLANDEDVRGLQDIAAHFDLAMRALRPDAPEESAVQVRPRECAVLPLPHHCPFPFWWRRWKRRCPSRHPCKPRPPPLPYPSLGWGAPLPAQLLLPLRQRTRRQQQLPVQLLLWLPQAALYLPRFPPSL